MGGRDFKRPYVLSEDPYFQQGVASLARMFQPDSPQDILAGERVKQMRADTERRNAAMGRIRENDPALADYFDVGAGAKDYVTADMHRRATQPGATPQSLDAPAFALFGDANKTFAGMGIKEAGDTQRANLQQAGALERSRLDNAGALERTRVEEAGRDRRLTTDQTIARAVGLLPTEKQQKMGEIKMTGMENVIGANGAPVLSTGLGALGQRPMMKPEQQSPLSRLISERDALPANDPNRISYQANIDALGRGQQQSRYDQKQDEDFAQLNADTFKNANTAQTTLATLNRMEQALQGQRTGSFAGAELEIKKGLEALGVPVGDKSGAELLRALGNSFALKLRDPSMGAGMPGALSDKDREFLTSMSPGLGNTPEGNTQLIDYFKRVNQRSLDTERLRQDYIRQKGRVDEGFRRAVTEFANANPLFPEAGRQGGGPGASAPQFRVLGVRPSGGQ